MTALDVAVNPDTAPEPGLEGRVPIELVEPDGRWLDADLYVATPALLARYGVDLDAIDPDTEILTVETGDLAFNGNDLDSGSPEMVTDAQTLAPSYSSLPGSFITPEGLQPRGWQAAPSGHWLVETSEPLTSDQLATVRDVAAAAGLTIEARDPQTGLQTLRSGATAVGMLLALGILAMTVGLIRSEAAGDIRTLTATGASSNTRRTLTAATASGLAVLGVALGTVGAYAAVVAGFVDVGDLTPIPLAHLAAIAIGTPLAAAAGGWLLAGREPPVIARQPIA